MFKLSFYAMPKKMESLIYKKFGAKYPGCFKVEGNTQKWKEAFSAPIEFSSTLVPGIEVQKAPIYIFPFDNVITYYEGLVVLI